MRKILYISTFSVVALAAAACDDMLVEVPRDTISPVNFYQTADDAITAVNGAYAAFQDNGYYSRYYPMASTRASDNTASRLGPRGDRGVIMNLIDAGMIVNDRYVMEPWGAMWQAVNRANAVLTHVPGIEMDERLKARVLAEAKFLRGLHYFNLVRRYGGVPVILTETSTSNLVELQVTRNTADEVYAQILKDLTEAAADLPYIKDYSSGDVGRASKEAALGVLAKVQLYRKDWANAKKNALAVINSPSGRALMPHPRDNWHWLSDNTADNNAESIFEVQYNGVPQGHILGNNFEPNASGYGPGSWGTAHATLHFYNKFSDNDKRKAVTFLTEYPDRRTGETIHWWENRYPAPHVNKFRDPFNPVRMAYNIKILRLADVMLVAAEAANESGDIGTAYQYVNRVRNRAGLPDLAGLSQAQLRDSIHLEFRKELAYEGQDYEELVRQGRLFEEKIASTTYTIPPMIDENGNVVTPSQALLDRIERYQPQRRFQELDPWNVVFPIPQPALDKNPRLEQNPGY